MTYKNKLKIKDFQSNDKKRVSSINQDINQRKYTVYPLDDQQGTGAILDLIFKVAPHLLQPIAEAVGTKVSRFIRGEGSRLAGNGVRLAGDYSANQGRRFTGKRVPKNGIMGMGQIA